MSDAALPPHAHPFRMIDVVLELEHELCTTIKGVTTDEVVRDRPEATGGGYPFALLLEAMAQAAIPLAGIPDKDQPHASDRLPPCGGRLVGIDDARLLRPARTGDRLLITASITGRFGALIRVRSVAELATSPPNKAIVAEAEFTIALLDTA
jgi:3-hydroxymyristoyl/3-hydroxydecanoyl-(acyl carrier protein) dehydratase